MRSGEIMEIKIIWICVLLLLSVFFAGCLMTDDNLTYHSDLEYNLNYPTTAFQKKDTLPKGDNIIYLDQKANISFIRGSQEILEQADLIVYGTVKEIKPSQWSTYDKALDGGNVRIYTEIVFTVDDWVKGESLDEITVLIYAGQIGNDVFVYGSGSVQSIEALLFPAPWDFKEGETYLLYLNYLESFDSYNMNTIDGI
jgi:hypothetical protein